MPVNRQGGPWDGGYISLGKGGRKTFFIERTVNGVRFHVSTRCHTERGAYEQLTRFEADPNNYTPEGEEEAAPLRITSALVDEFKEWQLRERGNTKKHANEMAHRLADWILALNGKDLRTVTLGELKAKLEGKPGRQHRIIALKSFCAWLRKEKELLKRAEDPTEDLAVPQARPEKWKRRKVVEFARVHAAYQKLDQPMRDVLLLMTATGYHVTELERFSRDERSSLAKANSGTTIAVMTVIHKNKEPVANAITDPEVAAAAERVRERGSVPRRLNAQLKAACIAAEVEPFTFGVMRHSVATWAVELGASPAQVSEFLHHKDPRTTKRHYIDLGVPVAPVRLPVLRVVKG